MTIDDLLAIIRWLGGSLTGTVLVIAGYFWARQNKLDGRIGALEQKLIKEHVDRQSLETMLDAKIAPLSARLEAVAADLSGRLSRFAKSVDILAEFVAANSGHKSLRTPLADDV